MPASGTLWTRVEELVDRAQDLDALRLHGVELIAARLRRRRGLPLQPAMREDERRAAVRAVAAPVLLKKARAAYEGELMLMKGPEVAARYPEPAMRPFIDLDLLAGDADAARRALLAGGFVEVGDPRHYEGIHHLRPVAWPGLPLAIELHRHVNHASWLAPPATAELLGLTRPSACRVEGLLAPIPEAHTLLLAVHAWTHEPLRRLLDLIDMAVLWGESDSERTAELARRWGLERIWQTTIVAIDALLGARRSGLALRLWGRHLTSVRERTVLETHLALWASHACGLPGARLHALRAAMVALTEAAHPREKERWGDTLRRTSSAVGDAFLARSKHERLKEQRSER